MCSPISSSSPDAGWSSRRFPRATALPARRAPCGAGRSGCTRSGPRRGEASGSSAGKNAVDERRRLWPARAVDREAREGGVTKENGDGDVGDRDIAEQISLRWQLALEIAQHLRDLLLERASQYLLIGRLAPQEGVDRHLVEETPDEDLAHACVGRFRGPGWAGALADVGREQRGRRVTVLEVLADDGRIGEGHPVVHEHGDAADRAHGGKPIVPHERNDRIDLVGEALHVEHDEHLAYVGRDVRPDDPHHPACSTAPRLAREGAAGCRSTRDKEANWLPAPADRFILMLRMYWPKTTSPSILNGTWKDSAREASNDIDAGPAT